VVFDFTLIINIIIMMKEVIKRLFLGKALTTKYAVLAAAFGGVMLAVNA